MESIPDTQPQDSPSPHLLPLTVPTDPDFILFISPCKEQLGTSAILQEDMVLVPSHARAVLLSPLARKGERIGERLATLTSSAFESR